MTPRGHSTVSPVGEATADFRRLERGADRLRFSTNEGKAKKRVDRSTHNTLAQETLTHAIGSQSENRAAGGRTHGRATSLADARAGAVAGRGCVKGARARPGRDRHGPLGVDAILKGVCCVHATTHYSHGLPAVCLIDELPPAVYASEFNHLGLKKYTSRDFPRGANSSTWDVARGVRFRRSCLQQVFLQLALLSPFVAPP